MLIISRINPHFIRLWKAVRPYSNRILLAFFGMVGASLTEPVFPWILKVLTDNGFSEQKSLAVWMVPTGIVGIFSCAVCLPYARSITCRGSPIRS